MAAEVERPFAVAVRTFTDAKLIDGGDTVAIRFIAADGQPIAVLIPVKAFAEMQAAMPVVGKTQSKRW